MLYKFTEFPYDAKPTHHSNDIPERYRKALLKKSELTSEEKKERF